MHFMVIAVCIQCISLYYDNLSVNKLLYGLFKSLIRQYKVLISINDMRLGLAN